MDLIRQLLLATYLAFAVSCYGRYKGSLNPLLNNYSAQKKVVVSSVQKSLADSVNPQRSSNMILTNPRATSFRSSTTTTKISIPSNSNIQLNSSNPVHKHTVPLTPAPLPQPPIAHAHSFPPKPKSVASPGFPHVHSGHPYIAPAVAPQKMTYQQIIEYLVNTSGKGLVNNLQNGSGNFLVTCKAYCDTLPESPVCDSNNVLYRNQCEAKCVNRETSTSNLRYGVCCCSDGDFDYSDLNNTVYGNGAGVNLCLSNCIYNCLGQDEKIRTEHVEEHPDFTINLSTNGCANLK